MLITFEDVHEVATLAFGAVSRSYRQQFDLCEVFVLTREGCSSDQFAFVEHQQIFVVSGKYRGVDIINLHAGKRSLENICEL